MTYFLFDLDGTLVRLRWDAPELVPLRKQIQDLFHQRNLRPPFGMMVPTLAELGRTEPAIGKLLDDLEGHAARGATQRPHAEEILRQLAHRGLPAALVTSNGRQAVALSLRAAGLDFLGVDLWPLVCREDVQHFKPHPQPIQMAIQKLRATKDAPQHVVMVGDAATDMQAAKAAGVVGIGVLGGVSTREDLLAAEAHQVMTTLAEMVKFIDVVPPRLPDDIGNRPGESPGPVAPAPPGSLVKAPD